MHIQFNEAEVNHFLSTQDDVVESFVVEDPSTNEITDFISFYSLPSSVLKHPQHKTLRVAYCYYYFNEKNSITDLMRDLLIMAKNKGYDVFNALDIQKNSEFMEQLKFGVGDGNLHYYFYNWRINKMTPQDCGIVLV